MGLAKEYNKVFKRGLLHFAAWSPLTDTYEVGDFGLFRQGVFQTLGNIREFGVDPQPRRSSSSTRFSYTSTETVIAKGQASAAIQAVKGGSASLEIGFRGDEGFFIRTQELTVMEMPSVDSIASQLFRKRDASGRRWNWRWRIVRKVYIAEDPVILGSVEKQTSFSLSGSADAVSLLELGKGSASISVSSNRGNTLQIIGGTGPIALDLFRVRVGGRAGLVSFAPGSDGEEEPEVELDEDWDEIPDDEAEGDEAG